MAFWFEVLAGFFGNVLAGILLVTFYVAVQWFLTVTDITIGYSWKFEGPLNAPRNLRPAFDIRNRSRSKTYLLANVAYLKNGVPVAPFDNKSIWGRELKPGSIEFLEAAPIRDVEPSVDWAGIEVHVRLQTGRQFWLKGVGPGQLMTGRVQKAAFYLRSKFESKGVPLE